jgi:hypothetical protein
MRKLQFKVVNCPYKEMRTGLHIHDVNELRVKPVVSKELNF